MKKIISFSFMIAAISLLGLSSCKKDSNNNGPTGSADLDAGKSAISFDNSGSFAGASSFSLSNTMLCNAIQASSGGIRNISLRATETSGVKSRTVVITILVDPSKNTDSEALTSAFDTPTGEFWPTISLSSTEGTTVGESYVGKTGTVKITKLTSGEIEGEFSGVVENDAETATLNLSNGHFAGKF